MKTKKSSTNPVPAVKGTILRKQRRSYRRSFLGPQVQHKQLEFLADVVLNFVFTQTVFNRLSAQALKKLQRAMTGMYEAGFNAAGGRVLR